jgi:sporulation integral membrane protein YtvI
MSLRMVLIVAFGLVLLYGLFTVGSPFLLALICAIFLEPLIQLLIVRAKWSRLWGVITVCSTFTIAFFGLFYLLGLNAFGQLLVFWKNAPAYFEQVNQYINEASWRTQLFYDSLPADTARQLSAAVDSGLTSLTSAINGIVASLSGFFLGLAKTIPNVFIFLIVFFIALFLISFQLPSMKRMFIRIFDERSQPKVEHVLGSLRQAIFGFLRAQFILSSLTYVAVLIGLLIIGVDYPLAIALLIVIVDILPVLGTGSVLVPWAVYSLLTDNVRLAIGLVVLFLFVNTFRRVIEPKILSDSIGINPLAAVAGLYIGFKMFGAIGLLYGPAVVIIYSAMRKAGLLKISVKLD